MFPNRSLTLGDQPREIAGQGQIRCFPKGDIVGQVQFFQRILGIVA
jgi:hypothetical protein